MHIFSKNTLIFFGIYWLLGLIFGLLGTQAWLIYSEIMLYLLLLLWFVRIFRLKTETFDKLRQRRPRLACYLAFQGCLPLIFAMVLAVSFTPWFPRLSEEIRHILQNNLYGVCWGSTLIVLLLARITLLFRRSDDPLEIIEGDKDNPADDAKGFVFNLLLSGGLYWIVFLPLTAGALRFNSRELETAGDIWRTIFALELFWLIFIKTPDFLIKFRQQLPLLSRYLASFGWLAYFWLLVPFILIYELSVYPHGIPSGHWLLIIAPYAPLFNLLAMLLPLPLMYWREKRRPIRAEP